MARLVCFYSFLDPRTEASLKRYAPACGLEVEWVETPGTGTRYAEELEKRWTGEDDLILVEHDKEIYQATLPSLLSCFQPWCAATYWIYPEPHTTLCVGGFGCTRFSAEVQQKVPVSAFAGTEWLGIDRRFYEVLKGYGIGCCLHAMVTHHHVYEPRPAAVRRAVAWARAQGIEPPAMAPAADPALLPGSYRLPGR